MSGTSEKHATKKPRTKITPNPISRVQDYDTSYFLVWDSVSSFYLEAKVKLAESPISCSQNDPYGRRPMSPFDLTDFIVDFENAVSKVCRNDEKMADAVISLLREQHGLGKADITPGYKYRVIQKVGRAVERLQPGKYWRVTKKRRHEEERRA